MGVTSFFFKRYNMDQYDPHPTWSELLAPHVESFNYCLNTGLPQSVANIPPIDFQVGDLPYIKIWVEELQVGYPSKQSLDDSLLPSECRIAGRTYDSPAYANICIQIGDGPVQKIQRSLGRFPILVMSDRCHLKHKSKEELINVGEEGTEGGGYFIVNGNEKNIRLLIVPRRNYVIRKRTKE